MSGPDILDKIDAFKAEAVKTLLDIKTAILGINVEIGNLKVDIASVKSEIGTVKAKVCATAPVPPPVPPTPPPLVPPIPGPTGGFMFDPSVGFPLPSYESGKMTPESFLVEVEEFLTFKGVPQAQWHALAGRFFKPETDISCWWRAKKSSFTTWNAFKTSFKSYESCDYNYDQLLAKLYTKHQKLDDAFETFAWDMHSLFMRVDPKTQQTTIIERILSSCISELSTELRPMKCTTVEDLVKQARVVINTLNRTRKYEKKPLLRARQSGPIHKVNETRQAKSGYSHQWPRTPENSSEANKDAFAQNANEKVNGEKRQEQKYCNFHKSHGHNTSECRNKPKDETNDKNAGSLLNANGNLNC
ncbi:unnamed protein product [Orchesella dallaii]|uniref:Retrotransposon gag domain-containing protein n=1 Tax=Orchesella dallaii TaxID=48710 RepID=A0ABP1RCK2_9HEXA